VSDDDRSFVDQLLGIYPRCPDCDGTAAMIGPGVNHGDGVCNLCHGDGEDHSIDRFGAYLVGEDPPPCPRCGGSRECPTCGGKGYFD
jgi:DnaJ-class molecular chaperone